MNETKMLTFLDLVSAVFIKTFTNYDTNHACKLQVKQKRLVSHWTQLGGPGSQPIGSSPAADHKLPESPLVFLTTTNNKEK